LRHLAGVNLRPKAHTPSCSRYIFFEVQILYCTRVCSFN
jgi:hypothetical protein